MLAFPRELPQAIAAQQVFDIQRVDYLSPEAGGRLGAMTAGFPIWTATWTLATIGRRASDELIAWIDAQRGSQRRFYGYDVARPAPRFHLEGRPYTINPVGWSQAIAADGTAYLTLTGCLPGTTLSHADLVGFEWAGWKRSLVRVVESGSANGAGQLTVAVEPAVPTMTPATAVANLRRPTCLMRLAPGTAAGTIGRRIAVTGGKIVAVQDLVA